MAYPKKLLNDGEEVRVEVSPHWSFIWRPVVATAVAALLAVIGFAIEPVAGFVALALLVASVVWLVARSIQRSTTEVVVTSDRLIHRSGVFSKSGIEIPLERVNNIMFRQSFVERLLGSGDLVVESAGESGQQRYTDIPRPSWVQNQIYLAMEAAQARDAKRISDGRSFSVADELAKLAELRASGVISQEEFEAQKHTLLNQP
jgi:uncharacterized membrane protein YdbT with pleckstrin-like domain